MPQPVSGDQDDSAANEVILGVDTHNDVHAAAVITAQGVLLANRNFPATGAGYRALVGWVDTLGILRRAGVEGTGSYGAALARHLRAAGVEVIEVNAPDKATRRRRGKTDTLDAEAAARAVLSGRASGSAKTGDGPVEMLRMFKLAKDSAIKARTQTINQLKAVLVAADPHLREALSGLTNTVLIRRCAQLESTTPQDVTSAAVYTLRLLAGRILELTKEICDLVHHITDTITVHCPRLLTRRGVGPDNAAALLITAGDNPDRLHSEASFAALCGVNPLEASSGKTHRRRLNRGGDRQANSALYRIALSRLRWDTRTRDYLTRRTTEGKTRREAIRCLKRYLAREIYQIITSPPQAEPSAA
ncbi:MAG TPA: IS110 family transposase [Pseudonocardiaceae bacterium]|nr:IS110 family transposase [Pseudonocardiaceae bacterium]